MPTQLHIVCAALSYRGRMEQLQLRPDGPQSLNTSFLDLYRKICSFYWNCFHDWQPLAAGIRGQASVSQAIGLTSTTLSGKIFLL